MSDHFRGHEIRQNDQGEYYYPDTGELVSETWKERGCGFCGLPDTPEGHDGCLGAIPGLLNACCGHGRIEDAYLQVEGGMEIRGQDAVHWFEGNRILEALKNG